MKIRVALVVVGNNWDAIGWGLDGVMVEDKELMAHAISNRDVCHGESVAKYWIECEVPEGPPKESPVVQGEVTQA